MATQLVLGLHFLGNDTPQYLRSSETSVIWFSTQEAEYAFIRVLKRMIPKIIARIHAQQSIN